MKTHHGVARALATTFAAAVACAAAHGQTVLVDASTAPIPGSTAKYLRGVLATEFGECFVSTDTLVEGVRIFERVGDVLEFQSRLETPAGVSLGNYGITSAVSGDTLMVGAPTSDLPSVPWNGRVLVHRRTQAGVWALQEILTEPAPASGDFGFRITLGNDLALIDEVLFARAESGSWSFVQRLPLDAQDYVDSAIEGDSLFLTDGKEGVIEYRRNGEGALVVVGSAVPKFDLLASYKFGRSFDVSGERMVVSSTVVSSGMLSVFRREFDGDWEHVQDIFAPSGTGSFGVEVAIAGSRILASGKRIGTFTGDNGLTIAYRELGPWTWAPFAEYRLANPFDGDNFGSVIDSSGDSFLVFCRGTTGVSESFHLVEPSDLLATTTQASLAQFGEQWLHFRPEPSFAGGYFALLGSASGTSPGIDIGAGVVLPLVYDAYFVNTATGFGPFYDGQGWIDDEARAAVRIFVPNGTSPSLAGTVLHHAFLAYSPATGAFTASRPVALEIVP